MNSETLTKYLFLCKINRRIFFKNATILLYEKNAENFFTFSLFPFVRGQLIKPRTHDESYLRKSSVKCRCDAARARWLSRQTFKLVHTSEILTVKMWKRISSYQFLPLFCSNWIFLESPKHKKWRERSWKSWTSRTLGNAVKVNLSLADFHPLKIFLFLFSKSSNF